MAGKKYRTLFNELNKKYGIAILSELPEEKDLPKNTIFSYMHYDNNKMPLQWVLGFSSDLLNQSMDIDLRELQKKAQVYNENNYQFLSDDHSFHGEVFKLADELRNAENHDKLLGIITRFNHQYSGQLSLEYTLDEVDRKASFVITDPHHCFTFNFNHTLKQPSSEKDFSIAAMIPKASASRSNFWCRAQTAAAVVAGVSVAAAAICLSS